MPAYSMLGPGDVPLSNIKPLYFYVQITRHLTWTQEAYCRVPTQPKLKLHEMPLKPNLNCFVIRPHLFCTSMPLAPYRQKVKNTTKLWIAISITRSIIRPQSDSRQPAKTNVPPPAQASPD